MPGSMMIGCNGAFENSKSIENGVNGSMALASTSCFTETMEGHNMPLPEGCLTMYSILIIMNT